LKNEINLETPWHRFRVLDLFKEHLDIDLRTHQTKATLIEVCKLHSIQTHHHDSWNDLYFKLWLNCVEPKLPKNKPCFVTHYPLAQSALCNPIADETGFLWANRFEVYLGQLELGNAFDELRDPVAQRKNFEHDQLTRTETYGDDWPQSPMDEALLNALPLMPPTCGIAIGFDRLAMVILDASDIKSVLPLPSHWPTDPVL
jgi:lysyl-tRNA synthetase class 2